MKTYHLFIAILCLEIFYTSSRTNDNKKSFEIIGDRSWGYSFVSSGDINGDGYSDMIVANTQQGPRDKGNAYIVYGGPTSSLDSIFVDKMKPNQGIKVTSPKSNQDFIGAASADVNKDGYADIILAGQSINKETLVVYVIYGGKSLKDIDLGAMDNSQGFKITGLEWDGFLIFLHSVTGDINGDGYEDIIIGNPRQNIGGGSVLVIYGGASLTNIDVRTMTESQGVKIFDSSQGDRQQYFGFTVSSAGDVNKDGFADLVIGSDPDESASKFVFVIYGGKSLKNLDVSSMTKKQGFAIISRPHTTRNTLQARVSSAGDFNQDGYADIIIGSPGEDNSAGNVYIIYGGENLADIDLENLQSSQGIKISGYHPSTVDHMDFGLSVSSAGDFNGDGFSDVIIGNDGEKVGKSDGVAYLIYGGKSLSNFYYQNMTSSQGFQILSSDQYGSEFGYAVRSAGDVNRDGFGDVIIGRANFIGHKDGAAYVLLGRPNA